jgi:hypothetical protein
LKQVELHKVINDASDVVLHKYVYIKITEEGTHVLGQALMPNIHLLYIGLSLEKCQKIFR